MIDILIIDNENAIARFIGEGSPAISVYDDEICALNAVESSKPAVILINYTMQKAATMEFISVLFKTSARSQIVLIANELSDEEILDCLAAGAKGYLQIIDVEKFINQMIKAILNGEAWISRRLVAKLLERVQNQQAMAKV
jgi:DNA-binding NarL/FixJ family response regulator